MRFSKLSLSTSILMSITFFTLNSGFAIQRQDLQLWYMQRSDSTSDESVRKTKADIDRAVAAGYTGVMLWDGAFDSLDDPNGSYDDQSRLQSVIKYAASKHLNLLATAAPFSFALKPTWAEAERVIGSQFRVDRSKRQLIPINSFPGLENSGFESGRTGWFDLGDAGTEVDSQVKRNGGYSGMIRSSHGNARFHQKLVLKPWREYHLTLFYKTQDFHGFAQAEVLDRDGLAARFNVSLNLEGTHEWTQVDHAFNSGASTEADLYFGAWGASSGTVWFDDVQLEETALIYVLRTPRTPLRVYNAVNPQEAMAERSQLDEVEDPRMMDAHPFQDTYHTPPTIRLPIWSHLTDGEVIAMDYYAVFPIPGSNGVSMCLTDQGVLDWLKRDARAIRRVLPSGAGIMMQYDEIRQMNSCGSCRAKHMTAGELLAWNVEYAIHTFNSALPRAPLYVWNDMFDPYHNALNNYYYVEGTLAGSWKALPSTVTIMNWQLDNLSKSLTWFSGLDPQQPVPHDQIIAGYYDHGNGASDATEELRQAAGIPGVKGLMYTTWGANYKELSSFAEGARAGWPEYVASLANARARLPAAHK